MDQTLEQRRHHELHKYRTLARTRPSYGSSNHGRHALNMVLAWKPRMVVDFGCGNNAFIRSLRDRGIEGVGIDFANGGADVLAAMHEVPLDDGIADVVTSFDALEHLLPEEVDCALDEMRRVAHPGGRFVFSICTKPSRITVDGENLHPTVRPIDWWLERISRVGIVDVQGRYISGRFLD